MACASDVDIDYDSCTPEIDSKSPIELDEGEAATFTVAFTGAVILDADNCYVNMGHDESSGDVIKGSVTLEGVEGYGNEDDGYTRWNITVSAEELASCGTEIYIVIAGVDGDGNTLYADDGGYTTISYYYTLVSDNPDLSAYTFSPTNESKVESIKTIEVGYPFVYNDGGVLIGGGIDYDWNNGDAGIANSYIMDSTGATVATAKDAETNYGSDDYRDDEYYYGASVTMTYDPEITTPGTYTVVFPAAYFVIDAVDTEANSQKFTLTYTIPVNLTFDPESGTVEELSKITVSSTDGKITYVSDDSEFTVYKDGDATDYLVSTDSDGSAVESLTFEVAYKSWTDPETITEAGVYTIVFPGNTFSVNGTLYDEPVELTYTIESKEPITLTFDPESGSTVDSLTVIVVKSEDGNIVYASEESDFAIYLGDDATDYLVSTDSDGTAADSLIFEVAYESWTNPQALKDAGTYTITFPEGTFTVNGTASEEVILSYTVSGSSVEESGSGSGEGSGEGDESGNGEGEGEGGTETGISAVQAAIANGAEVYTISGQKVTAPVNGVNIVKYADGTVKKILQK